MPPVTLNTQVDSPYSQGIDPNYPITTPIVSGNDTGYHTTYVYTIGSFFGATLSNVPVNESFGARTNVYNGNNWPSPGATSITTDADGRYSDNLQACSSGIAGQVNRMIRRSKTDAVGCLVGIVAILVAVSPERPEAVQVRAGLRVVKDQQSLPSLIAISQSPVQMWHFGAVYGLRNLRTPKSMPALIKALDDADQLTQYEAVIILAEITGKGGNFGPGRGPFLRAQKPPPRRHREHKQIKLVNY